MNKDFIEDRGAGDTGACLPDPETEVPTGGSGECAAPEADVLIAYITRFQKHCDRYLAPIADPKGKRVLIVGTGHGTEVLWCIGRGAREIVGVDVIPTNRELIVEAARRLGFADLPRIELMQGGIEDMAGRAGGFDLVLSNNVFEHLPDVSLALSVCAGLCRRDCGLISIFSAPLYYSSAGAHLSAAEPWEHLWGDEDSLRARTKSDDWEQYETLNRMTIADVVAAIRTNNLLVEKFEVLKDRNWGKFKDYADRIRPEISRTDLCLEGFSATLRP